MPKLVFLKKKYFFEIPEQFLCFKLIYMLQNFLTSASPTNPSPNKKSFNFLGLYIPSKFRSFFLFLLMASQRGTVNLNKS